METEKREEAKEEKEPANKEKSKVILVFPNLQTLTPISTIWSKKIGFLYSIVVFTTWKSFLLFFTSAM